METTFDLSSLSEGVSAADLETLKMSINRCLPSSLFEQLLDVEEVSVSAALVNSLSLSLCTGATGEE